MQAYEARVHALVDPNASCSRVLAGPCGAGPTGRAIGARGRSRALRALLFSVGSRAHTVSPQACLWNILRDGGVHGLVPGGT